MSDTNETIADIIADKRRRADKIERDVAEKMKRGEMVSDQYAREPVADIRKEADRLDATHKREVDALKQRLNELDAEVAAKDAVIKRLNDAIAEEQKHKMASTEKSSAVGDCAKLREALVSIKAGILKRRSENVWYITDSDILEKIDAALAAPPRNCDIYSHDEALNIWAAENEKERNGCFDEWLYHEATEKEGGNNENE